MAGPLLFHFVLLRLAQRVLMVLLRVITVEADTDQTNMMVRVGARTRAGYPHLAIDLLMVIVEARLWCSQSGVQQICRTTSTSFGQIVPILVIHHVVYNDNKNL